MLTKSYILIIFILLLLCYCSCSNSNPQIQNKTDIPPQYGKIDTIKFTVNVHDNKSLLWNKIVFPVQIEERKLNCFLDNCISITMIENNMFKKLCSDTILEIINREDFSYYHQDIYQKTIKYPLNMLFNQYILHLDTIVITDIPMGDLPIGIGIELFKENIIEIDFQQDIILLHQTLPKNANTYEVWNMFIDKRHNEWRRVKIDGFISENGKQMSGIFLVDLGGCISLLSPTLAKELSISNSMKDTTTWAYRFLSIVGAPIKNHRLSGSKNSGQDHLLDMEVSGTIGMDFLLYYNLIFDYSTNKLYLKRR